MRLRPATPADAPFLAALHAAVRADEVAAFGWPAPVADAFLGQQHAARERHYALAHPGAQDLLAEVDDAPVGRLLLDVRPGRIDLVDLAVHPAHQRAGHGTALLAGVLARADATGAGVRLTVRADNTGARRLYARLGFAVVADDGLDLTLERTTLAARTEVPHGSALRR